MTDPNSIRDLSARFPGVKGPALEASAYDVQDLIAHLASSHELTLSEASEAIEEWQAGLAVPPSAGSEAA